MTKRLEYLELLRFVLAFCVVVYHYFYVGPLENLISTAPSVSDLRYLLFSVDAFFVISGVVIMFSAANRTVLEFCIARFARLGPALLVCSTLTFAFLWLSPVPALPVKFMEYVRSVLVVPLALGPGVDGSMWSLKYEIIFYVIIAGCIWRGITPARLLALVVFLLLSDLVTLAMIHFGINLKWSPTVHYGSYFAIGILFYLRHHRQRALVPYWAAAFAVAAIDAWTELARVEGSILHHVTPSWWEGPVIAAAIGALVLAALRGTAMPALSRLFRALGMASYPLYLIHQDLGYWLIGATSRFFSIEVTLARWLILALAVVFSLLFTGAVEPGMARAYRKWCYSIAERVRRAHALRTASQSAD